MLKWCIAHYPWFSVWWPPAGTWAKRKTYPPLAALRRRKKERERGKIAPKRGSSHMALSGAIRRSTKAGRRKERQLFILNLSNVLHPQPGWGKLWRSEERQLLSEWQSEWERERKSRGTNEPCQRTPQHLLSCLWIGTRIVINIYNAASSSTSLLLFAPFVIFSAARTDILALRLFCTLDHSFSASVCFLH